jgi:hypothetical protein
LALAPSVAFSLSGLVGLRCIRKKTARPLSIVSMGWLGKSVTALLLMVFVLRVYVFLLPYAPGASFGVRAVWCAAATLLGIFAYAAATLAMKFEEWNWIKGALRKDRASLPGESHLDSDTREKTKKRKGKNGPES